MYKSDSIKLNRYTGAIKGTIQLPASKSISNRLLIINALSKGKVIINNLSEAKDTEVLKKMLLSDSQVLDVGDAGTSMRFLTAFKAISGENVIMQGSERMHQRPISSLVSALKEIGAKIEYLQNEGFPPLKLQGFEQVKNEVSVPGNISSQFITALLLIAPALPQGLKIKIEDKLMSRPYVEMTIRLMRKCGVEVKANENIFIVEPQTYQPTMISVESDWSSASYWFSLAAQYPGSDITLKGLQEGSFQGDIEICEIAKGWGVKSQFVPAGVRLVSQEKAIADEQMIDFSNIPDLAQTVAVAHSLLGIMGKYIGLESLRIKETDRIKALQEQLRKIGANFEEQGEYWVLTPSDRFPDDVTIETYQDHRMAMAFAPLISKMNVTIENRDVTRKSYPGFWNDLSSVNVELK